MKVPSKENNPGVIVLGGHVQALGIIRTFGQKNIQSIIIDNTFKNIARHSCYCAGFYHVSDDNLLSFLLRMGLKGDYNAWLIFPTNDFHVQLLSINKNELGKFFKITCDDWKTIEIFYNKKNAYNFIKKLELPFPETFFPSDISDLEHIDLEYPCIIKPAVMHEFFRKVKKKVFFCKNKKELVENYRKALSIIPKDEVIIQNIIPGSGKNQFSACFLHLNGQTINYLTACRMRQHPIDFGNATTYAETVSIQAIREMGEKILVNSNYNGICEIEFKKDERDGKYKFLEVNTRTWKWHYISQKAEVPFLLNMYKYLTSGEMLINNEFKPASFRHVLTDLPTQFKLFFKGYLGALRVKTPVVNAVWSKEDVKPWLYEKFYLINLIKNR